jgi:hypothetical protein
VIWADALADRDAGKRSGRRARSDVIAALAAELGSRFLSDAIAALIAGGPPSTISVVIASAAFTTDPPAEGVSFRG